MPAVEDLQNLAKICSEKRMTLIVSAHRKTRWRLNVAAGVLALLSAASITAIIAGLTNSSMVKSFAALIAFSSGLITLEVQKSYEGAAKL
jgi:hypothetical protein